MRTFSRITFTLLISIGILFSKEPVRGKNGMVVTASKEATEIGLQILKNGGNAVDAAVAVGFALSVSLPAAGNIGGGGFMVLHLEDGTNITIDFRETAPAKSTKNMFLDEDGNYELKNSTTGGKSVGIPGTVDGLILALEKYGTMKLKDVIQPSIDLAKNGFVIGYRLADNINYYNERFNELPSSKKIFTNNGSKLSDDHFWIQNDLANTLTSIRDFGRKGFYEGDVADKIIQQVKNIGGIMTLEDLKGYKSIIRKPIISEVNNLKIVSMPPPSSGGIALTQIVKAMNEINFTKENWGSVKHIHNLVEILKRVYADRAKHLGDPDFYPVPVKRLTDDSYIKSFTNKITYASKDSKNIFAGKFNDYESDQTTHYSVADKKGNAVSVTYTLNSSFGNKCVVEGAGFLLNNEMDDFVSKPGVPNQFGLVGNEANSIAPGKRMLSSMTPTIILKNEKPFMILGGRGGSKIITAVAQVVLNVVLFNMNIQDAVDAPRVHHQWLPDRIDFEKYAIIDDVKRLLIERAHKIGRERKIANVEAILIDDKNYFWGAADPRGFGLAKGY